MPWVNTKEQFESRACDVNEDGHRSYTRYFKVYFNSLHDGPAQARIAPGIPAIKSVYASGFDYDGAARCTAISVQHVDAKIFGVTCTYSTDADQYENPLDKPAVINFGSVKHEVLCERDVVTGRAIVNSAGQPFNNAPVRTRSHSVITITRNEPSFDEEWARGMRDRVNSGTWNGIAAKRVYIDDIAAHNETAMIGESLIEYAVVTYTLVIHADDPVHQTWRRRILDQGFKYLQGGVLVDESGAEPVLLNGSGAKLANPATSPAQFRTFDVLETADFDELEITF